MSVSECRAPSLDLAHPYAGTFCLAWSRKGRPWGQGIMFVRKVSRFLSPDCMVSNSQRTRIIISFVLDFFFPGRHHLLLTQYLVTHVFLTHKTPCLFVTTQDPAPGGIHEFPPTLEAGGAERGGSRRCQEDGLWERFPSLIKEDRCSQLGCPQLDLRCIVWSCTVISTWLIRL